MINFNNYLKIMFFFMFLFYHEVNNELNDAGA